MQGFILWLFFAQTPTVPTYPPFPGSAPACSNPVKAVQCRNWREIRREQRIGRGPRK